MHSMPQALQVTSLRLVASVKQTLVPVGIANLLIPSYTYALKSTKTRASTHTHTHTPHACTGEGEGEGGAVGGVEEGKELQRRLWRTRKELAEPSQMKDLPLLTLGV